MKLAPLHVYVTNVCGASWDVSRWGWYARGCRWRSTMVTDWDSNHVLSENFKACSWGRGIKGGDTQHYYMSFALAKLKKRKYNAWNNGRGSESLLWPFLLLRSVVFVLGYCNCCQVRVYLTDQCILCYSGGTLSHDASDAVL